MPRIRSIKPEFWTSEQILECSTNARLLFIGLWNFADDAGRHPDSAKQAKAEVFPGDDLTLENIRGMLDELSQNGLINRYTVDGKGFFEITGWHHQRIDRPQDPKYPGPFDDHSTNEQRTFVPDRKGEDRKGRERKGENKSPAGDTPEADAPGRPPCPHQRIIELYHEILPELPTIRSWTEKRKRYLAARWREDPERQTLDWWRAYFEYIRGCPFLMGQTEPGPGRSVPFLADLEWIVTSGNFVKIIEGKYEPRGAKHEA